MDDNATYHWFWTESFWFPVPSEELGVPQYGWKDLRNKPGSGLYLPEISDINWSLLLGVVFLGVRYLFETLLVVPIGTRLGVSNKRKPPATPNPALESAYKQHKRTDQNTILALSKQTDMTKRQIEIWMRRRHSQYAPSRMQKLKESSWHMVFYLTFSIYGVIVLWDKPWFSETKHCWIDWPNQHISNDIYWYYMLELGFYWSLVFTLFTDHRRKDFVEMTVHHVATITLLYFSWVINFVRVGTLVLLVHDAVDPWLGASKMGIYIKNNKMTDICFITFVLIWIVSRLILFPFVVIYTTTFECATILVATLYGGYCFFNFFLYLLQILHILWTYSIFKILYNRLIGSDVEDTRSDEGSSDSAPESEDEHNRERSKGMRNGTSNGKSNGTSNGTTKGKSNGTTKGKSNGTTNGIGEMGCHTSGVVNGTIKS